MFWGRKLLNQDNGLHFVAIPIIEILKWLAGGMSLLELGYWNYTTLGLILLFSRLVS